MNLTFKEQNEIKYRKSKSLYIIKVCKQIGKELSYWNSI